MNKVLRTFTILLIMSSSVLAYDNVLTHREITSQAVEASKDKLIAYIQSNLGYMDGLDLEFYGQKLVRRQVEEDKGDVVCLPTNAS